MKLEMTLLAIAAATVATLAGSVFADPDSARGAGRARAPGADNGEAMVLVAKGTCNSPAARTVTGTPAAVSGSLAPVKSVKTARGAGRARAPGSADSGGWVLVAQADCARAASDIEPARPVKVSSSAPGLKSARGAGRARAPGAARAVVAIRD